MKFSFWNRKSVPVIRQLNQAECGLACIAMVAAYHGLETTLEQLRLRFPISSLGTKLATMTRICDSIGLITRGVRLEIDELEKLVKPCILHWEMGHYVVLTDVKKHGITIHDPARGSIFVDVEAVNRSFTGVALEVNPKANFGNTKFNSISYNAGISWLKLAGQLAGFRGALVRSFALAVILELISLSQPVFTQIIVDQVIRNMNETLIVPLALGMLLLSAGGLAIAAVRTWIIGVLQARLFLSSTSNIFAHLLLLPSVFFEQRRLGDVVSRFNSIQSIQKVLSTRLVEVVLDGLVGTITLVVIYSYSHFISAISITAFFAQIGIKWVGYPRYAEASAKSIAFEARQQNRLVESVRLTQTIRTTNSQSRVLARFLNLGANSLDATLAQQRCTILIEFAASFVSTAEKISVVAFGAFLTLHGNFTVGALMASSYLSAQFASRSRNLLDYVVQLRLLKIQQSRLADIVLAEEERNFFSPYVGNIASTDIALRNVSFRYSDNDPWVVRNLNLEIKAGDFVAIIGASGSGKSTLVKLLAGIISPPIGTCTIGDVNIEFLGKERYRDMLGIALQDAGVFSGSVADNISMFDEEAVFERIEVAAKMACVHADLVAKPMGYHTQLGGIESHLSAGQRQKIILARVFYKMPDILILDEATCHIDVRSEREILRTLRNLTATKIMVTHRWEAAHYADRVFDVENGLLLERKDFLKRFSPAASEDRVDVA